VTRRGLTTADRRPTDAARRSAREDRRAAREDRRSGGRSVAERAFRQIRFIAVVLVIIVAAGYRPSAAGDLEPVIVRSLAGATAALLLLVALLSGRADRAASGRRSKLVLLATIADAVVVLGVVSLAGLPPRSFALVLLMLPLLEAALWFGLSGLAMLWTVCSVALGAYVVVFPDTMGDGALGTIVVAMPTLLLATIPVAMLAEHLVAQVGRLVVARQAADDRAHLLGDLSAITAEIFPLDVQAVLTQLVTGAGQLGAADAVVTDPLGDDAGRPSPADTPAPTPQPREEGGHADGDDVESTVLSRELPVPGRDPYLFTATVSGAAEEVARRVEALDLLVAQARVGLANAALVQQLETLKQTYQEQATRDQLTGLLNRRGLVLTAEQIPGHLGVLFCDLDGFKGVNDTLGHAAGDELLEKVARRLDSAMREDSVLGRMGGDEFVVVVPGASDEDLAGLGRRIEIDLGKPFLLEAGMARIGVSIGAAHAAPGQRDLDSLLGQADSLMYEVKRSKKGDRAGRGDDRPVGVPS
jgi:diguanylate cyclase (GGDEF)-like protein